MWEFLKRAEVSLRVVLILAAAYLGYVWLERHSSGRRLADSENRTADSDKRHELPAVYNGTALKIIHFYARDAAITEGQSTLICYGVLNAKSVRIDPPVTDAYPALNRCVEVAPEHDTKYILTSEGNDGQTATAEFSLTVKPDLENLPRITSFRVEKHTEERGHHYFTIAFQFQNARTVMIDPPIFSTLEDSAPFGQFVVGPEATTTYTLTVMDKKGRKAQKQLTVEVPKG
jgi:hypothetical protein